MGEVSEAIRRLIAQGLTSGEIIANGYRPGTVYKVQRSMRLAAALAQDRPPERTLDDVERVEAGREGPADLPEACGEVAGLTEAVGDELRLLRDEIEQVNDAGNARMAALESRIVHLERGECETHARIDALEETVRWLRQSAADAVMLLAQQTIKPAHPLPWAVSVAPVLERVRERLVEVNPAAARSLFGGQATDR